MAHKQQCARWSTIELLQRGGTRLRHTPQRGAQRRQAVHPRPAASRGGVGRQLALVSAAVTQSTVYSMAAFAGAARMMQGVKPL
jgi:hypothetical protein